MKVREKKLRRISFSLIIALFFVLFFVPPFVHAAVIASGSFESGYGPWISNYGGSSVVSDSTAPNGTHSLRFNFPAGFLGGNAPDIVTPNPESFSNQEEVYIQFYVKYSSNWVDHPITNKLVYIWFGEAVLNLPLMGHSQWDGKGIWGVVQASNVIAEQVWHSSDFGSFTFTYGVWHKIVIRVKMNVAGSSNGIFQVWVDDTLRINASNGKFRNSGDSYGITSFSMTPVYGGMGGTVPADQYIWFDDVIIQTTPFGTSSTNTSTNTLQPAPPFRLSIN